VPEGHPVFAADVVTLIGALLEMMLVASAYQASASPPPPAFSAAILWKVTGQVPPPAEVQVTVMLWPPAFGPSDDTNATSSSFATFV
jgi:hypothetical protein